MKKIFLSCLVIMVPLMSSACLDMDTRNTHADDREVISGLHETTTDVSLCIEGDSADNDSDYYKFTVAVDGQLDIHASSSDLDDYYYLEVGSPSDTNQYYGTERENIHNTSMFLRSGDEVYIRVKESGSDTDNYQLDFDFNTTATAPTPPENGTGTCYAMSDNSDKFYIVSMAPGASPLPNPIEKSMTSSFNGEGSAYRASDNKLYAFKAKGDDKGPSDLYTIDVETSTILLVEEALLTGAVDGSEFYYDKVLKKEILYVISGEETSKLYAFDTTDWSALDGYPKNLSGEITGISSIAINPISGEAYGIDDYDYKGDKPILYQIDLATGITSKIIQLTDIADAEGLAFASDGNLYVEDEGNQNDLSGRKIYKINLTDGSLISSAILGGSGDIEGLSCNGMELAHKSEISGHIYHDREGTADVSEKISIANAKVSLYDENGTVVDVTRTDVDGYYQLFAIDGNYSVVVDSKTLHTLEDVWMEQTYGPVGGLCNETILDNAGACYGGKRGNYDDDNSSLESIEHIATVLVNDASVEDMDFGFSANVVVNIEDAGQGSLRQFVINSNAIESASVMKFAPAVAQNEASWWSITLLSPLPSFTRAGTVVDGATGHDENSGEVENAHNGEKVGTQEIELPSFNKPELEINANDMANENGVFVIEADDITIKHIALYNASSDARVGILVKSGENNKIVENFIGSRADGSDPQEKKLQNALYHDSKKAIQITDNFIAFIAHTGIFADNNAYIANNSLYRVSNLPLGDAITTETSSGNNIIIENNRIEGSSSYGIESWNSPSIVTIRNNTLIANGQDTTADNEGEHGGIRVYGENNLIQHNVIRDHIGAGIVVTGGKLGNEISQNSIYNNGGLGIDIDLSVSGNRNGDGVTVNNGTLDESKANNEMDYPVFTSALIDDEKILHLKGYVGTEADLAIFEDSKIEIFVADKDTSDVSDTFRYRDTGDNAFIVHGEGKQYIGACLTVGNGNFDCSISVSDELNITNKSFIVATATGKDKSTSEFGANMAVSDKPKGEFEPVGCNNTLYLSNSNILGVGANTSNMYLHSINIAENPFLFPAIGEAYTKTYNALAYNVQDDYLYALYMGTLVRIDKSGSVQEVGAIEGITKQHYSGVFDKEGNYYVGNWANHSEILKIDIDKRQIVSKIDLGESIEHWDMTISNDGKNLYLVNVHNGQFTKVNILSEVVTEIGGTYTGDARRVASIYSDVDNRIFILLNEGGFYEINPENGTRYFVSNTPKLSGLNDGANCPNASLSFYDLGDAPDSYANAEHTIIQSLKLGSTVDHEQNRTAYSLFNADGDDVNGIDDEDAIADEALSNISQMDATFSLEVNLVNITGQTATLRGWMDFDRNGIFDSDEDASVQVIDGSAKVTLTWSVTPDIKAGESYLRLRLSQRSDIEKSGSDTLGEVEDYKFEILPRPVLDAWGKDSSISNKKIFTQVVKERIDFTVASLTPDAKEFMQSAYKKIEVAIHAEDSTLPLTEWQDVNLSDVTSKVVSFEGLSSAHKKAYLVIRYEDDFNVTRENNASDKFAIRPFKYMITKPTDLVAGKDFNITVKAVAQDGTVVTNYEEEVSVYKLDINESIKEGCSFGEIDIEKNAFDDGESIVTVSYSDIGMLEFEVTEINASSTEFAHVDYDDGSGDSRFIESGKNISAEITPANIALTSTFESDANDGFVFYAGKKASSTNPSLKNETNIMAAKVFTYVEVRNEKNDRVKNFKAGCAYAKPITVTVTYDTFGQSGLESVTEYVLEQNEAAIMMGNPSVGSENILTYTIGEDLFVEGEGNQTVRVNFHREKNRALNPMTMRVVNVHASVGTVSAEDDEVKEQTFIYLKAHVASPQTNIGKMKDVKVDYEVYSKDINMADFGLVGLHESEDEVDWYIIDASLSNDDFDYEQQKTLYGESTTAAPDASNTPSAANADKTTLSHTSATRMKIIVPKLPTKNKVLYTASREYLKYNRHRASVDTHSFVINFLADTQQWMGKGDLGMTIDNTTSVGNGLQKLDW